MVSVSKVGGLIKKAKGQKCDICYQDITKDETNTKNFEYSKTKRKSEVWVHKTCWNKLYGKG